MTERQAPALAVYRGNAFEREVPLGFGTMRVGRALENDLVLEDPDKGVSRFHAELRYEQGAYVIADLNSQNGVWVDDRRVLREVLRPGVPVTIGPYRLVLDPGEQSDAVGADTLIVGDAHGGEGVDTFVGDGTYIPGPSNLPQPVPRRDSRSRLPAGALVAGVVAAGVLVVILAASFSTTTTVAPPAVAPGVTPDPPPPAPPSPPPDDAAATPEVKPEPLGGIRKERGAGSGATGRGTSSIWPQGVPKVAPRPGEPLAGTIDRARQLWERYREAKAALDGGNNRIAILLLQSIANDQPGYLDTAALLNQAARAEDQGRQQAALRHVKEAERLAQSNNLPAALKELEAAQALQRNLPGVAAAIASLRNRIEKTANDYFVQARQYDTFGQNAQAIAAYEKVIELLPESHPKHQQARQAIAALRR